MRLPHNRVRGLHLAAAPLIGAFVYSRALRDDDAQMAGDMTVYAGDELLDAGLVGRRRRRR